MKLNIDEQDSKSIIIEFVGADRGIPELLKEKLLENKSVNFVSVIRDHPEIGSPKLVVKADKSVKALVLKAAEELEDEIKQLTAQIPKK